MITSLSKNFTYEEATFSSVASRRCIDNNPPAIVMDALVRTAGRMEAVRVLLGDHPLHVDSWYRCPMLNFAVNGAAKSAHMSGWAVDFLAPSFGTPLEVVQFLQKASIDFDQLIQEGSWVHISFAPELRRSVLTAVFRSGRPTTYTLGA